MWMSQIFFPCAYPKHKKKVFFFISSFPFHSFITNRFFDVNNMKWADAQILIRRNITLYMCLTSHLWVSVGLEFSFQFAFGFIICTIVLDHIMEKTKYICSYYIYILHTFWKTRKLKLIFLNILFICVWCLLKWKCLVFNFNQGKHIHVYKMDTSLLFYRKIVLLEVVEVYPSLCNRNE